MNLAARLILSILIFSLVSQAVWAGRRSGGSRRRGGSSGGSRRKGLGSIFGGWGKKKTNPNPQSSYPKQEYKPVQPNYGAGQPGSFGGGGFASPPKNNFGTNTGYGAGSSNIGGGGFVAPPKNKFGTNTGYGAGSSNIGGGGFAAPPKNNFGSNYGSNYGSNFGSNYGSKYGTGYGSGFGSGGFGHYNSMGRYGGGTDMFGRKKGGLFSGGGKKAFALGAAGGFVGGAVAGIAAMETYHRYKMFKSMMEYKMYGGGYGYGGYGMGRECFGGCPIGAFCDFGMCRCRPGYDDRYGQCWDSVNSFNKRESEWNERMRPDFNPYQACSMHETCTKVDMNMVCSNTTEKCECRKDMKWNEDTLECQVFMDVDCSDVAGEKSTTTVAPAGSSGDGNPEVNETFNKQMNLTEYDFNDKNITDLSPNDTLANSLLTKINVNKTSETEIRRQFCREIKFLSKSYRQPLVERRPIDNSRNESPAFSGVQVAVVIAICLACFGGCFLLAKKFSGGCNKHSPPSTPQNDGNSFNMNLGQPPQEVSLPSQPYTSYPPAPENTGMPVPGQPAVPAAPGYAPSQPPPVYNTPYPPASTDQGFATTAPYPPSGDNPPYPPTNGTAPYPPAPGSAPYPAAAGVTPYPPQPAENPGYPSAPGYPTQQPPPYSN